jgi:hypothetical protein
MKRRELIKELQELAKRRGLTLELARRGGNHDIYQVGDYKFPVARHAEIPERTAQKILKEVEGL